MNQPAQLAKADLHLDLSLLPTKARVDFHRWEERIAPVLKMQRGVMAALDDIAKRHHLPVKTVRNKYYAAKKQGLLGLVDRRLAGPSWWRCQDGHGPLPQADADLVKKYCESNQRSSRSAMKELLRDWRAGKVRSERPTNPLTGYPYGWSLDNLSKYASTEFERIAARRGLSAATAHRPLVYSSRRELWVGSHYMFDDMWHNLFVNSFAERQAGRPLELFSHDLFSGRKVRWGYRVRTTREDGIRNGLTGAMSRWILAATLHLDGYSPRGTVLVLEHGTATQSERLLKALHEITGGLVTASFSGMQGAEAHAGQYPGIVRGNPRHKASLESSNNLVQNVFASLPGQTGKDRQHAPEELPALLKYNDELLRAYDRLPAHRRELLEFPILESTQFGLIAQDLYAAIENDTDHELTDWIECGHVAQELLIGGQWVNQAQLMRGTSGEQDLALQLIETGQIKTRPRRMSRREVWDQGAHDLIKLPGHGVVAILGDDLAKERKVRSGMFEFEDQEAQAGATFRFDAVAWDPMGRRIRLEEGQTYETFLNPFDISTLYVRKADGSYIGECRQVNGGPVPSRADVEAVHRAMGKASATEAELLQGVRRRAMPQAEAKLARHRNNAAVLSGEPVSEEEVATHDATRARVRAERGTVDDLMPATPGGQTAASASADETHEPEPDLSDLI